VARSVGCTRHAKQLTLSVNRSAVAKQQGSGNSNTITNAIGFGVKFVHVLFCSSATKQFLQCLIDIYISVLVFFWPVMT
jgi:hypothetical protein